MILEHLHLLESWCRDDSGVAGVSKWFRQMTHEKATTEPIAALAEWLSWVSRGSLMARSDSQYLGWLVCWLLCFLTEWILDGGVTGAINDIGRSEWMGDKYLGVIFYSPTLNVLEISSVKWVSLFKGRNFFVCGPETQRKSKEGPWKSPQEALATLHCFLPLVITWLEEPGWLGQTLATGIKG